MQAQATVLIVRTYGTGERLGAREVVEGDFFPADEVEEWWDDAEQSYAEVNGEWRGRRDAARSGSSTRNS